MKCRGMMQPLIAGALVVLFIFGTVWLDRQIRHGLSGNPAAANEIMVNKRAEKKAVECPPRVAPWAEQVRESKVLLKHVFGERKRIQESDTINRKEDWLEVLAFRLQEAVERLDAKKKECEGVVKAGDRDTVRDELQKLRTSILDEVCLLKAERDYARWRESDELFRKKWGIPDTPVFYEYKRLEMTGQLKRMTRDEITQLNIEVCEEHDRTWGPWGDQFIRRSWPSSDLNPGKE